MYVQVLSTKVQFFTLYSPLSLLQSVLLSYLDFDFSFLFFFSMLYFVVSHFLFFVDCYKVFFMNGSNGCPNPDASLHDH